MAGFPKLIGQSWKKYKPEHGKNWFKKTGIVPLSRSAISTVQLQPSRPLTGRCNDSSSANTTQHSNLRVQTSALNAQNH